MNKKGKFTLEDALELIKIVIIVVMGFVIIKAVISIFS